MVECRALQLNGTRGWFIAIAGITHWR